MREVDVAVVGAGAAGLMAAIFAAAPAPRVVALDGAPRLGAKILISGGGRCNVTHDVVRPENFYGANRNQVAKVLRTFDVEATVAFFARLGVELKREETGKLFPVSNKARTVLDALVAEAERNGAELMTGARVQSITRDGTRFIVESATGTFAATAIVLATGGRSVPKTGSDGGGYALARALGHTVTATTPALVPLVLASGHWLTALSGTSIDAALFVESAAARRLHRDRGSLLFTHFGLSGPLAMDVSRHWIAARDLFGAGDVRLRASLLPDETFESLEAAVVAEAAERPRATPLSFVSRRGLPERLAAGIVAEAGLGAETLLTRLKKEERRALIRTLVALELPVIRDRGFDYAEVTAGGVPLGELDLATMESRVCPGLFLCGEILDVDGRIGGYNFQWAWASGKLAGEGAGRSRDS
jgi:predicted Rossmann fold flavoprotein